MNTFQKQKVQKNSVAENIYFQDLHESKTYQNCQRMTKTPPQIMFTDVLTWWVLQSSDVFFVSEPKEKRQQTQDQSSYFYLGHGGIEESYKTKSALKDCFLFFFDKFFICSLVLFSKGQILRAKIRN